MKMNKTKLAVFGILIVTIMCWMAIDAGPYDTTVNDNTTFRVHQGVRASTAHQRTQAASGKSSQREYGRVSQRSRGRGGQYQYGNRPCKGDRCASAAPTPAPKTSAYSSSSYYDEND